MNRFIEGVTKMVNFKISKRKTALKYALLLTASFLSFNNAQAGKFKEIPIKEKEIYLQYDDDEGRRDYEFTIEIGNRDKFLQELENSIKLTSNKGLQVIGVDFSNSDLTDTDLFDVFSILQKYKIPRSNISNTHIENVGDEEIVDVSQVNVLSLPKKSQHLIIEYKDMEDKEDTLEMQENTSKNYKFKVLRSIQIPQYKGKLYEDSDSD